MKGWKDMTKRTIEQILEELRRGRRPLLADKPAESDASRYDCPRCKDQGGYLIRQNGLEVWTMCSCMAERKVKRLLGASEITHAFRQLGFREFRTQGKPQAIKDAFECAKEYVADYEQIKESRKTALPF